MRVLYITDALAVWGGIERVLCDKTNYLVREYDYDVYILTTDQGTHLIPYSLDKRINLKDIDIRYHHQYRYHGIVRFYKYIELTTRLHHRLKRAICDICPDVIICVRMEMVNTIIKVKGDIPMICESHSMCKAYLYEHTSFWNRLKMFYSKLMLRKADCVVSLTEGDANDWHFFNGNVRVIPNVVHLNDKDRYSNLQSKIVLFVGRFTLQKDVWSLLDVWRIVNKIHPDWELHVYGEGEEKEQFANAANSANVNIKIFNPTSDIFDKYLDGSLLIMTSLYEPFGLVLPEAMSCGLPVVAFNCPYGPADIISDGINGFLIENRDVNAFADRVLQLIDNPQLRSMMGQKALVSANNYRAGAIMPLWNSLFREFVGNK